VGVNFLEKNPKGSQEPSRDCSRTAPIAILDASVQSRSSAFGFGCDKCNEFAKTSRDLTKASRVSGVQIIFPSFFLIDAVSSNNGACNCAALGINL